MGIDKVNRIVVSRTDSIGDVALTLPSCGLLKKQFPEAEIIFLGQKYTTPIIECCEHVSEVWDWSELEQKSDEELIHWLKDQNIDVFLHVFPNKRLAKLAKQAQIPHRIGTSHRLYHRLSCNHRPNFTRKRSELHEAQLNTKLLEPLGISSDHSLGDLSNLAGFKNGNPLPESLRAILPADKTKVILHTRSQGSAVEWAFDKYLKVIEELDPTKYEIYFSGTEKEMAAVKSKIPISSNVHDLSGKTTLEELISLISEVDVLVAASTGPLHIAGLCGIKAIGLFSVVRPIHSGRWKPLGIRSVTIEDEKNSDSLQPLEINYRVVVQEIQASS